MNSEILRSTLSCWIVCALFATAIASAPRATAQVTYTYTGSPFTIVRCVDEGSLKGDPTWCLTGPITATAQFNIPADYTGVVYAGCITNPPVDWSLVQISVSIGGSYQSLPIPSSIYNVIGNCSGSADFEFANGNIIAWSVQIDWYYGCNPAIQLSSNGDLAESCNPSDILDGGTISGNSTPGSWTRGVPVTIASTLPAGQAGMPYGPAPFISGGVPPYGVNGVVTGIVGLPAGLIVDPLTGNVVGDPANPRPGITSQVTGPFSITGSISDATGAVATVPPNVTLTVSCGNPNATWIDLNASLAGFPGPVGNGDNRDALIQEHIAAGIKFYEEDDAPPGASLDNYAAPHCTDFTQSGATYWFNSFNAVTSMAGSGLKAYSAYFNWTIISSVLTQAAIPGPHPSSDLGLYGTGLDAWIYVLIAEGDPYATKRSISSSYRNPARNAIVYKGRLTQSNHQYGAAIDMLLVKGPTYNKDGSPTDAWMNEWDTVATAARWAHFLRIEGSEAQKTVGDANFTGPCYPGAQYSGPMGTSPQGCVHADMQTEVTPSPVFPYVNP